MLRKPTTDPPSGAGRNRLPQPGPPDPWRDLSIATLRRGPGTPGAVPDSSTGASGQVVLLAVLDDGAFVVADTVRAPLNATVRVMAG